MVSKSTLRCAVIFAVLVTTQLLLQTVAEADVQWFFDVTGYAGTVTSGPFSSQSECESYARGMRAQGYSANCYSKGNDASTAGADLATPGLNPALQKAAFDFGYAIGNWLVRGHKSNATSAKGPASDKTAEAAAAQKQQQAYMAELERQRQEANLQRILAEQQRLQATFDRLSHELRISPSSGLSLKGFDSNHMLQLKTSKPGSAEASSGTHPLKTGEVNSPIEAEGSPKNPDGCLPAGIAGLPGVYLGCQTAQTSAFLSNGNPVQLAQAAQELSGPEKDLVEDSALRAAAANPQFMAPSRDTRLMNFQELDADYQRAQQAQNRAAQGLGQAREQNEAAKAAVHVAQNEIAKQQAEGSMPPAAVQQAFDKLNAVANTDEEAVAKAQREFDNAHINVAMARTKASYALVTVAPAGNIGVVDLRDKQQSLVVYPTAIKGAGPIAGGEPITASPARVVTKRTAAELCTEVAGLRQALRRLSDAQDRQDQGREQWLEMMDDATRDAGKQAVEFATEGSTALLSHYLDQRMQETVLRRAGEGIDAAGRQGLDREFKALWDAKETIEVANARRKQLTPADPFDKRKWKSAKAKNLEDWLEDAKDLLDKMLADPAVKHALKLSERGAIIINLSESMIDSGYTIEREIVSIKQIKILNQSTEEYLAAVKRLKEKMESTVKNSAYTGNCAASL